MQGVLLQELQNLKLGRAEGITGLVIRMTPEWTERSVTGDGGERVRRGRRHQWRRVAAAIGIVQARTFKVRHTEAKLLEVVLTLAAGSRFAHLLHRGQQETNQHCNDRDHHQQFNQRERISCSHRFLRVTCIPAPGR